MIEVNEARIVLGQTVFVGDALVQSGGDGKERDVIPPIQQFRSPGDLFPGLLQAALHRGQGALLKVLCEGVIPPCGEVSGTEFRSPKALGPPERGGEQVRVEDYVQGGAQAFDADEGRNLFGIEVEVGGGIEGMPVGIGLRQAAQTLGQDADALGDAPGDDLRVTSFGRAIRGHKRALEML